MRSFYVAYALGKNVSGTKIYWEPTFIKGPCRLRGFFKKQFQILKSRIHNLRTGIYIVHFYYLDPFQICRINEGPLQICIFIQRPDQIFSLRKWSITSEQAGHRGSAKPVLRSTSVVAQIGLNRREHMISKSSIWIVVQLFLKLFC